MRKIRIVAAMPALALGVLVLAGCNSGNSSGAVLENRYSANIEQSFLLNQPPPHFQHSDIRAAAISIEAIQALGEQTTSFGFNMGEKNPVWTCPSLGEPVASTTEITNPTMPGNATDGNGNYNTIPVGNMDPNGIYAGASTGTYVLCVNAAGQQYTQYWEGFVDSVSGPATWDAATGSIKVTGAPTMPACKVAAVGTRQARTTCTK